MYIKYITMNIKRKKKVKKKKLVLSTKEKISKLVADSANSVWCPNLNIDFEDIKTNSWFDLKVHNDLRTNLPKPKTNLNCKFNEYYFKAITVELFLTDKQKYIINNWLDAYTCMYNDTIDYLRKYYATYKKYITNFINLRELMMNSKSQIIQESVLERKNGKFKNEDLNTEKYIIKTHMMDQAIKSVCSNLKSMMSNKRAGHIRHFRLRYLKYDRKNKIMKLEKSYFKNNSICPIILGQIKALRDGNIFNLNDVVNVYKSDCTLKYDTQLEKYYLYVPQKMERVTNCNTKEFISFDPGCRKFLTGISEDQVIMIGTNVCDKLLKKVKRLEKLKKIDNEYIRKQKIRKCREKMSNMVDDFHWKTIKYVTDNYRNVLIGNLSTKAILSKKYKIFSPEYKKVIQCLSLYKFRERLKDKCDKKSINYKMVNEYCTTKICSLCGYIKENVRDAETYKCDKCKIIQDRDVNSSRNIYLKRHF